MRRKLSGVRFRVMVVVTAGTGGVERVVVMGWYYTCGWARSEGELLIGGEFVYPFPKCCRKCNAATTGHNFI